MTVKTFITPPEIPLATECVVIEYPADKLWRGNLTNALLMLTQAWRWEQVQETDLDPATVAEVWREIVWAWLDSPALCAATYPTPFWDDAADLDDQLPADAQTWYGEVTDPDAPADEITFLDNAAIWVITGFIAATGDIGAAIAFNTIAPRFVLAWYRGDAGEIWRVVVNAADYGTVDTTANSPGDIIELDVLTDGETEMNEFFLIRTG